MDSELKSDRSSARKTWFWMMFFIILIPVYIFAQRPYGYTITRTRLESRVLGGIQKVLFAIAGGMAAGALAMEYEPDTVVKWSDGSTTRESNSANAGIVAIKLMLYAAALAIFCITSSVLMIYLTVQGLRRNYNWEPIIAKGKDYVAKITSKSKSESSNNDDNQTVE